MKFLIISIVFLSISCNNAFDYSNPYQVKKNFVNKNSDKCHKDKDCKKENEFCIFENKASQIGICSNPCDGFDCSKEGVNKRCVLNDEHEPLCVCKENYHPDANNQCIKANWEKVSAGDGYTCGIMNKNLYCWGRYNPSNYKGVLGLGNLENEGNQTIPVKVGKDNWIDISCSGDYACGIKEDNSLWCWGDNSDKKLISGMEAGNINTPEKIGNDKWLKVFTNKSFNNNHFTCALNTTGKLYCWGKDNADMNPINGDYLHAFVNDDNILTINNNNNLYYLEYGNEPYSDDKNNYILATMLNNEKDGILALRSDNKLVHYNSDSIYGICDNLTSANLEDDKDSNCNIIEANYIDSRGNLACIVVDRRGLYCYRTGNIGDLFMSMIEYDNQFYKLGDKTDWILVSIGNDHICAIDGIHNLYCIGNGNDGELGLGDMNKGSKNLNGLENCENLTGSNAHCLSFNKIKMVDRGVAQ